MAAFCTFVAIAGSAKINESLDRANHPAPIPAASGPDYKPVTGLEDTSDDAAVVNRQISHAYDTTGRSIDVVGADENAQKAFASYYENNTKDVPAVNEIVRVQGRRLFAPELEAEPDIYPFILYNATDTPIDVRFLDYTLEGTRSWLDEAAEGGGTITMGNHTEFDVEPHATPHAMIMAEQMPAFLPAARFMGTDGFTTWYADSRPTRSFILPNGSAESPFRKVAIATEICQSMVQISAARTLPGGQLRQNAMERFVAYVNPRNLPARHDIELAGKEALCNGLGRVIAASYQGGEAAISTLPEQAGKTGSITREPWIDFRVYGNAIPELIKLREAIAANEQTTIITGKSSASPTAAYYREQLAR